MKRNFGPEIRENPLKRDYINKWVIITATQGSDSTGKLVDIEDEWYVLNPYQSVIYDIEKGIVRKIIKGAVPLRVHKTSVKSIEETTKQNLETCCAYLNKQKSEKNK